MYLGLTDEQRAAIRRAATSGDYHLLLGAGASRDSVGPDGNKLPGSAELIEVLSTDFDVPAEEATNSGVFTHEPSRRLTVWNRCMPGFATSFGGSCRRTG